MVSEVLVLGLWSWSSQGHFESALRLWYFEERGHPNPTGGRGEHRHVPNDRSAVVTDDQATGHPPVHHHNWGDEESKCRFHSTFDAISLGLTPFKQTPSTPFNAFQPSLNVMFAPRCFNGNSPLL